jgi:hypothetical protein
MGRTTHAIANAEFVFNRLEVDFTCTGLNSLRDDSIYESLEGYIAVLLPLFFARSCFVSFADD